MKRALVIVAIAIAVSIPFTGLNAATVTAAKPIPLPTKPTPAQVQAYVIQQAVLMHVDPLVASFIVAHESQYGVRMRGDDGQSRGYWQISSVYHPEVSATCADSLQCSTAWSLNWIRKGHVMQWSTIRFCKKWYGVCPA